MQIRDRTKGSNDTEIQIIRGLIENYPVFEMTNKKTIIVISTATSACAMGQWQQPSTGRSKQPKSHPTAYSAARIREATPRTSSGKLDFATCTH